MSEIARQWRLLRALLGAELAAGILGLKIFVASVTVATLVVGSVWLMGDGLTGALKRGGTVFLGADVAVTVANVPLANSLQTQLGEIGRLSRVAEFRTSARVNGRRATVELKAVDDRYPLHGAVRLESGGSLEDALDASGGRPGVVVEPSLLRRTGAAVGDAITIGEATFTISDALILEPDRLSAGRFMVGPRVLMGLAALPETGIIQPGALIDYRYRLRIADDRPEAVSAVAALRPEIGWELETPEDAGDRVIRTVERTTTFLGMAGMVALAIGLAGMWASARAWISGRSRTIALYRLSGALPSTTLALHGSIIGIAGLFGLVSGLSAAALVSFELLDVLASRLHLEWIASDILKPLGEIARILPVGIVGAGVLALAGAVNIAPGAAMRSGEADPALDEPLAVLGVALIAISMGSATLSLPIPAIAGMTVFGLAGAILVLVAASAGVVKMWQLHRPSGFIGTIVQQGLGRIGSVASRAVAIGIGIAGITAMVAAQGSLENALKAELPDKIPDLVLIDVQPDQVAAVRARLADDPALTELQANPFMRMTVTRVNGVPAEDALKRENKRWTIEGDRSFSWSAAPTGAELLSGEWWPADYDGPPVVSPEEDLQEAFDLVPGDTITYSVLGRSFTSTVANVRKEYHRTFQPEFLMVASPNPFRDAPQSWVMSVEGETESAIDEFVRSLSLEHPNITSIDIRQIVTQVTEVIDGAIGASLLVALILIVAGGLCLAAVVAADVDARRREALVFVLIGASRTEISLARLAEALCIGAIAGIVGGAAGLLGGFWLVRSGLQVAWAPGVAVYGLPLVLGLVASAAAALAGRHGAAPKGRGRMARYLTS